MKKDENAFSKQQQEFTAMAVRNLPYVNAIMMQHFIENPNQMKSHFLDLHLKFWENFWKTYYENVWGRKFNWKDIFLLGKTEDFIELVVVLEGISEDDVLDKMVVDGYAQYPTQDGEKCFLKDTFNCERRTEKSYGIWLEEGHRYINIYKGEDIKLISEKLRSSANLLERLLWSHFRRYWSSAISFDIGEEPVTVCPGTISKDGRHFAQISCRGRSGTEYIYLEDYRGGYYIKKSQMVSLSSL
ncbi:MAG TPA: hypothetical protein VF941_16275 [Clostridia bacterium]